MIYMKSLSAGLPSQFAILISCIGFHSQAADLATDRMITIRSAQEAAARREALIKYIWDADGFPAHKLPDLVVTNVDSPVKHLTALRRMDELRMDMAPGLQGVA